MNTNRSAFRSVEKLFLDGPEFRLFVCMGCNAEVETVDSHTHCSDCAAERDAADERDCDGVANDDAPRGCATCDGYGVVRSGRMSPEADCDLDTCPACNGESEPDDAGEMDAWCDALRAEAIEHECAAERPLPHRAAA